MNYMYSALSNKQMELVNDENTSFEIIKKLDKLYLRELTALQICVRNRLDRLRLRDYTEVSEFYNVFEKLITELKNAGTTIDKKEKLNYILRTLPNSLYHIGDLVDVLPEQERTVDYVIEKIKMYENREKEQNQNSRSKNGNSNVFKIEIGKDGTSMRKARSFPIRMYEQREEFLKRLARRRTAASARRRAFSTATTRRR